MWKLLPVMAKSEDFANLRPKWQKSREQFNDVESFIAHDIRFHQLLAVASQSAFMMLLALHQQLRQSIQEGLKRLKRSEKRRRNHIITLHQKICDARCAVDVETATQAMKSHFDSPPVH